MKLIPNNPKDLPAPVGGYSQSVEISDYKTLLFISGQIAESVSGQVPEDFGAQCEMIWTFIRNLLAERSMSLKNIVKINTFLTHQDQAEINSAIRNRFLEDHRPALTVLVVQTLDSKWLLEIDAIAAA